MSTLCNLLHFFLLLPEAIFNNNVQQQQQCGGSPNRIFKKRRKHWTLAALSIARDLPLPRLHLAPKSKLWNGCCDLRESLGSSNLPAIDFGEVRCWGGFQGLLAVKILKIRWPRSSFLCFFFAWLLRRQDLFLNYTEGFQVVEYSWGSQIGWGNGSGNPMRNTQGTPTKKRMTWIEHKEDKSWENPWLETVFFFTRLARQSGGNVSLSQGTGNKVFLFFIFFFVFKIKHGMRICCPKRYKMKTGGNSCLHHDTPSTKELRWMLQNNLEGCFFLFGS